MMETLLAVVLVAAAFMAVTVVKLRAGCGTDCGACERPCVRKGNPETKEDHVPDP